MRAFLQDKLNEFDFALRKKLQISRSSYAEDGFDLDSFLQQRCPDDRTFLEHIIKKYQLDTYLPFLNKTSFLDNLQHLILLDKLTGHLPKIPITRALDIGSKNFAYAASLHQFLKIACQQNTPSLLGIEIDTHRVYKNFYSRKAYADYYTNLLPNTRYLEGDILTIPLEDHFQIIFNFFPFIELSSLKNYRLPKKLFNPKALFTATYNLLAKNGVFIMANTTKNELFLAERLLDELAFHQTFKGAVPPRGLTKNPMYICAYEKH